LGATILNPDSEHPQALHSKALYPLAHGDLVSLRVSGSGVVIDPATGQVDERETNILRGARREDGGRT